MKTARNNVKNAFYTKLFWSISSAKALSTAQINSI